MRRLATTAMLFLQTWAAACLYVVQLCWAASAGYSRVAIAEGWRRLPKPAQDQLLDAAALTRAALVWLWLAFLSLATVWWDPAGCARRPISVRIGRARMPAAVHLATAATPLQLRLAAYFWRNNQHEHTFQPLMALLAHYGGDPAAPFDVSGSIVFDPLGTEAARRALPLAFRLQIDLVAKTFTLTHARVVLAGDLGPSACAHAPVPPLMNAVGIDDVLAPLLGRHLCPALEAGGSALVAAGH